MRDKNHMAGMADRIRSLFEPVARAVRRGDRGQLDEVLSELRTIRQESRKSALISRAKKTADEMSLGMTLALEGVLSFALASASQNSRRDLLRARRHALPVLQVLGQRAWRQGTAGTNELKAMQIKDLAAAINVKPQNLGDLISALASAGLVTVTQSSVSKLVEITVDGARLVETARPGWQMSHVLGEHRLVFNREKVRPNLKILSIDDSPGLMKAFFRSGDFEPAVSKVNVSGNFHVSIDDVLFLKKGGGAASERDRMDTYRHIHSYPDKVFEQKSASRLNAADTVSDLIKQLTLGTHSFSKRIEH